MDMAKEEKEGMFESTLLKIAEAVDDLKIQVNDIKSEIAVMHPKLDCLVSEMDRRSQENKQRMFESTLLQIADGVDHLKLNVKDIRSEIDVMHPKFDYLLSEIKGESSALPNSPNLDPSRVKELDELERSKSVSSENRLLNLDSSKVEELDEQERSKSVPSEIQEQRNNRKDPIDKEESPNNQACSTPLTIPKAHSENTPISTKAELDHPIQTLGCSEIEEVDESENNISVPSETHQRKIEDKDESPTTLTANKTLIDEEELPNNSTGSSPLIIPGSYAEAACILRRQAERYKRKVSNEGQHDNVSFTWPPTPADSRWSGRLSGPIWPMHRSSELSSEAFSAPSECVEEFKRLVRMQRELQRKGKALQIEDNKDELATLQDLFNRSSMRWSDFQPSSSSAPLMIPQSHSPSSLPFINPKADLLDKKNPGSWSKIQEVDESEKNRCIPIKFGSFRKRANKGAVRLDKDLPKLRISSPMPADDPTYIARLRYTEQPTFPSSSPDSSSSDYLEWCRKLIQMVRECFPLGKRKKE